MPSLTSEDELKILRYAIDELRRTFDHISNIYDQLRLKALTMLGGEVAIVTFVFSADGKLHIPLQPYGRVMFWSAILFLSLAFGLLLWTISPVTWKIPVEIKDIQNISGRWVSYKQFLEYVRDEYATCINHCLRCTGNRGRRFNWTIYLLSAGVIILLLVKYGG